MDPVKSLDIDSLIQQNLIMLENSLKINPNLYQYPIEPNTNNNNNQVNLKLSHQLPAVNLSGGLFYEEIDLTKPEEEEIMSPALVYLRTLVKSVRDETKANWLHPRKVAEIYYNLLSPYERNEIYHYSKIYYIGSKAANKKLPGNDFLENNYGYDDAEGGYLPIAHDHIAYRYEVLKGLGKGSFGQVLKVYDHKSKQYAALKIVRNDPRFQQQAKREVKILEQLLQEDHANTANIVHIKNSFLFRGHVCIVFELMSINLYELIKKNKYRGFSPRLVKNFAHSITVALSTLSRHRIIHSDLKPENILLRQPGKSGLKVIDFGSSCYTGDRLLPYVQSRFYRAPEVIFGCHYGTPVDMWSLGCILSELALGYPLLPGHNEDDQIALMIELLGIPPKAILDNASRASKFISETDGLPLYCFGSTINSTNPDVPQRGLPGSRDISMILYPCLQREQDLMMVDFIRRCLSWDPAQRLTPEMALRHAWFRSGEV